MTITYVGTEIHGLSTDTKPLNVATGKIFIETDSGDRFIWTGSVWDYLTFSDKEWTGLHDAEEFNLTDVDNIDTIGNIDSGGAVLFSDGSTQEEAAEGTTTTISSASFTQELDVTTNNAFVHDLFFRSDGMKMYTLDSTGADVNEYDVSTPWDISTAVFLQTFSITDDTSPEGIFFRSDGLKMYVLGNTNDSVFEYDLSIAWDVTTASLLNTFSVSAQDTNVEGLSFKSDGTRMYVIGEVSKNIFEYNLSTPWDISTAVVSGVVLNINPQDSSPEGITFEQSGKKLYVSGNNTTSIYQYNLSTAWDLATAVFVDTFDISERNQDSTGIFVRPNNLNLFTLDGTARKIFNYDLGVLIEGNLNIGTTSKESSLQVSANINAIQGYVFSDGSTQEQAGLASPLSPKINTAVFKKFFDVSAQTTAPTDIFVRPSGMQMYISGGSNIFEYTLTTPFDITTASITNTFSISTQDAIANSIFFRQDGRIFYIVGNTNSTVFEYTLSTAWDISTASFSGQSVLVSANSPNPYGLNFSGDGKSFFVTSDSASTINQFNMTTPWDLSTTLYSGNSINVSSEDTMPLGIHFRQDGKKFHFAGGSTMLGFEFNLSTPWDISSALFTGASFSFTPKESALTGIFIVPDHEKLYIVGGGSDSVLEYDLGITVEGNAIFESNITAESIIANEIYVFADDSTQSQAALSDPTFGKITTLRYTNESFDPTAQGDPRVTWVTPDGKRMYVIGTNIIFQYTLSTPWDISTATYDTVSFTISETNNADGIYIRRDGIKAYIVDGGTDRVYQYTFGTAFDLSTLTFDSVSFLVSSQTTNPEDLFFKPDGLRMYILSRGSPTDTIYEYDLTIPWDVSSAVFNSNSASVVAVNEGFTFKSDGTMVYVVEDGTAGSIFQYELTTPWDITTLRFIDSIPTSGQTAGPLDIFLREDNQLLILTDGSVNDEIFAYDIERPSKVGTDIIEVFSVNDLPAAVSGTITLPTGNYILKRSLELTDDIAIATNATVTIQSADRLITTLTFNQGGTFITAASLGATNVLAIRDITILLGGANAELFDTTGGNLIFNDVVVVFSGTGTKTIGSSATLGNGLIGTSIFQGFNAGWSITSVAQFAILSSQLTSDGTGSGPTINIDALTVLATMSINSMGVTGSESLFDFVNTITAPIIIDDVTKTGTGDFYTSGALDQTDVNVNTSASPGSPDSQIEAEADFLDVTGTTVTINTVSVAEKIGVTTWNSTHTQRSTISTAGVITYDGLTDKDILVNFSASVERVTGTPTNGIGIGLFKNGVLISGFVFARSFNAGIVQLSGTRTVDMVTGDTMELVVINFDNAVDINVYQANVTWNQTA